VEMFSPKVPLCVHPLPFLCLLKYRQKLSEQVHDSSQLEVNRHAADQSAGLSNVRVQPVNKSALGLIREFEGGETSATLQRIEYNHLMADHDFWVPNSGQLELEDREIHVWRADLDGEKMELCRFEETLAPAERARADRFVFGQDRDRYVAARGALRELLGRYLNCSPAHVKFDYNSKGKPSVRAEFNKPSVQFNISHSHGLALLAFALGRNLGIDVEFVRPEYPADEIAERYFSPQEVMELRVLPPAMRAEGFYLCWTRKEAYIKARGQGLHIPLQSFNVSLTPGQPERLESADSCRWSIWSLYPDPLYAGALVAEGQHLRLRQWAWKTGDGS